MQRQSIDTTRFRMLRVCHANAWQRCVNFIAEGQLQSDDRRMPKNPHGGVWHKWGFPKIGDPKTVP